MRNKSEVAPERPDQMPRDQIDRILESIAVGDRFTVWYLDHRFFTEAVEDGKNVLFFGDIVLDEEDAQAVRENRPIEFQMMSRPRFGAEGQATLMHNGKVSTFIYDGQGIHHIKVST